jgi:pimeloyl-ACP methyl ester carboxylesterase
VSTSYLDTPGGRLAYSDVGAGPLVIAIPGMGDLRSAYRFLTPKLVAAGYRVISVDARGHGESSVGWDDYSVGAVAGDVLRLIAALNAGPAHVIGNSSGAGAAVIAAARDPKAIRSLVLIAPFVRNVMPPWLMSVLFDPLLRGPWGRALWRGLYRKSFPTRLPDDFGAEQARRDANFAEAGRFAAIRRMAVASKIEAERSVALVTAPVLVLMGTSDSDFPKPVEEARHVATLLRGSVATIEGAGHYPQAEMPDAVATELISFLTAVDANREELVHAS